MPYCDALGCSAGFWYHPATEQKWKRRPGGPAFSARCGTEHAWNVQQPGGASHDEAYMMNAAVDTVHGMTFLLISIAYV